MRKANRVAEAVAKKDICPTPPSAAARPRNFVINYSKTVHTRSKCILPGQPSTRPSVTHHMKHLLSLLLLFLVLQVSAQTLETLDYEETARSFGEGVRVRKSPDLKAPVLCKLGLGEKVNVLAYTTDEADVTQIDGITLSWVLVRTASGVKGYVWSGLLAHASINGPMPGANEEGLLLMGLVEKGDSLHPTLRLVKDSRLIRELSLPDHLQLPSHPWMDGEFSEMNLNVLKPEGFDSDLTLLIFGSSSCACRCHSTDDWYLWDGTKFDQLVFTLEYSEDVGYAGSSFSSNEVIMPNDEGGKPNQLQVMEVEGRYPDEENGSSTVVTTWVTYEFREGQLIELERTEQSEERPRQ
jgi:hypothetical protein